MKNILITLIILFGANQLSAQYAPLKIGEAVPDFEFAIQNYSTPTAKLSDFKGKLIFLDFWSTNCTACINDFPKMESLQKQYGEQMQIILVNIRETEEEVKSQLKSRKNEIPTLKQMPSIINNEAFAQLFPHEYAGNYVWIDKNGILRLSSGLHYNIYKAKIDEVIAGKTITFLKEGKSYYKENLPLTEIIHKSPTLHADISSTITTFNSDYFPAGGQIKKQLDSTSNTIRSTYINRSILSLYYSCLEGLLKKGWAPKLYGPNLGKPYLDVFNLKVKDSTRYEYRYIPQSKQTDINTIKSLFCYEQVLPQNTTTEQGFHFMREDLDRYFGIKYETTVTIEFVELPCYLLKKLSNNYYNAEKNVKQKLKHLGKRTIINHQSERSAIESYFSAIDQSPYVFSEEPIDVKAKIVLPQWEANDTIEDFKLALRLNGFELFKGTKKIKMITLRDNS